MSNAITEPTEGHEAREEVQDPQRTISPAATKLRIDDLRFSKSPTTLNQNVSGRQQCYRCQGSKRFLCYRCGLLTLSEEQRLQYIPIVSSLPFTIHIIKHPSEKVSKSSAISLPLLCPKFIQLHAFPDLPSSFSADDNSLGSLSSVNTVLLFPSENAIDVTAVDWLSIEHVVAVDCSWLQTKEILTDPRLALIPRVSIASRETLFWRFQFKSDRYLSTAEAVYFVLRDYFDVTHKNDDEMYDGRFDDLLFFFALQYQTIMKFNGVQDGYKHIPSTEQARQRRLRAQALNAENVRIAKRKRQASIE